MAAVGINTRRGEDETLFVIEGEALAEWKEGEEIHQKMIKAGSAFYTPGGMENNVTNVGTRPLKAIFAIVKSRN
jgi:mannose-6-phosphate isomerase-like protein (cupin superfamily)